MEQHEPIRILCVDDEPGVLSAVSRCFMETPYEVLTALSGNEGLELLRQVGPVDLVISDFRMPGMNGVEFLQQVMKRWPATRRVILSAYTDSEILLAAVNEGRVHRFFTKPWSNERLLSEVAGLLKETTALEVVKSEVEALVKRNQLLAATNDKLQNLLDELLRTVRAENSTLSGVLPDAANILAPLSRREQQILKLLARGQRPKEIATDLGINIKTVSTYKIRLFEKLGFNNDSDLISFAIRHQLITFL